MGVGRQTKTEPSPLISCTGLGTGLEHLAGPALHLALGVVLVVRGPSTPTAQACDPIAHVQQHCLQGVGIHAPLVGLRGTLHILHNSACEIFTLSRKGSCSGLREGQQDSREAHVLWHMHRGWGNTY